MSDNNIWLSSDYHFQHNREFIYKPRGFENVDKMNETIIANHNDVVCENDDIYLLGDLMLGGPDKMETGLEMIRALKGRLHLVRGNHDTDKRWEAYSKLPNVVEQQNAIYLNYRKYHFYMTHYPSITSNLEKEDLHQCTINLYGHTHQQTSNFYMEIPYIYHVGLDSHKNCLVSLDKIILDMKDEVQRCINEL